MKNVIKKFPKLLHGGDYNPDQWLAYPEVLEKDIQLLKKADINCVSLGIFAWAALEPEEGVFKFDWLETIIDNLYKNGIYTVLATPTAAMPNWLTEKYEEVMQVSAARVRNMPGERHNYCMTSPVMREKTRIINTKLAERFGKHEGVILWHISNELGGNRNNGACHCDLCQEAFRDWLKKKYKTLNSLNHAWWATFWSHTYTSWNQIHSPAPQGEMSLHGLNLDWKRYTTYQTVDFYKAEANTLKAFSTDIPVTTNMMLYFNPLDYFKFAEDVDIISWDSYPNWHLEKDEIEAAVTTAGCHNIMRSIKKAPFLLMESVASATNWKPLNPQKRPGMNMLSSFQAVAHGSNSVQYFQLRKSRGSSEKFHGAVIGHIGTDDTREFRGVAEVGARLKALSDQICETVNKPEVAVIFDWENWWAVNDAQGQSHSMNYKETMLAHYKPFWTQGIDVDIIDMEQSLDGYKLVVAPMTYMMKAPFAEQVRRFVENGGTFVSTYWSGIVNETDLCFLGGFPGLIGDVMGITEEELDAVNENRPNSMTYNGKDYKILDLRAVIHETTAEVLSTYHDDYYKDMPTLTKNNFGLGHAYYISSRNEEAFQQDFYANLTQEVGIAKSLNTTLPYGVTATKRVGEKSFIFVQNFNEKEVALTLDKEYTVAETGEKISENITLASFECLILEV